MWRTRDGVAVAGERDGIPPRYENVFILKDISNFVSPNCLLYIGGKFIPPNFFEIDQVFLCQIYDVFNPGSSLLNHICDTDIEIGMQWLLLSCFLECSWFPFECSLSTLLESEDCWQRLFLSDIPTGSSQGGSDQASTVAMENLEVERYVCPLDWTHHELLRFDTERLGQFQRNLER
jgi:hypothetical protein